MEFKKIFRKFAFSCDAVLFYLPTCQEEGFRQGVGTYGIVMRIAAILDLTA